MHSNSRIIIFLVFYFLNPSSVIFPQTYPPPVANSHHTDTFVQQSPWIVRLVVSSQWAFRLHCFCDAKFEMRDGWILTGHFHTLMTKSCLIINVWAVRGPRTIYHVPVLKQTIWLKWVEKNAHGQRMWRWVEMKVALPESCDLLAVNKTVQLNVSRSNL
jgi:hypothetical protein